MSKIDQAISQGFCHFPGEETTLKGGKKRQDILKKIPRMSILLMIYLALLGSQVSTFYWTECSKNNLFTV